MSLLSAFANGAFTATSTVIGTVNFTIAGGSAVAAVKNEASHEREFEDGGFAPDRSLALVCNTTVFANAYSSAANAYVGNLASVGGVSYRIERVVTGGSTTTLELMHQEDAG